MRFAVATIVLGGLALLSPAAADGDPAAAVRDVMSLELWYLAEASPSDEDGPFSKASLARNFTPEYAKAYSDVLDRMQQSDEPLIDGDPILNAQDFCPPNQLAVGAPATKGDTAEVTVSFDKDWCFSDNADSEADQSEGDNSPAEEGAAPADELTRVVFKLVKRDGRWLIDDFNSGGSTRALLQQLLNE